MYEYECDACGHRFEQIRKFSDPPIEVCPNCGERKVHKLLSSPAIQFKGSGWYITDYARKGAQGSEPAKADGAPKTDEKGGAEKGGGEKGGASEKGASQSSKPTESSSSSTNTSSSAAATSSASQKVESKK